MIATTYQILIYNIRGGVDPDSQIYFPRVSVLRALTKQFSVDFGDDTEAWVAWIYDNSTTVDQRFEFDDLY